MGAGKSGRLLGLALVLVLGCGAHTRTFTEIECAWENPADKKQEAWLEHRWKEAQQAAQMTPKAKRPRVCLRVGAPVVALGGTAGFLCGYYERSNNSILVAADQDICPDVRCNLIHEYLHAIMGPGHAHHSEVLARVGCKE